MAAAAATAPPPREPPRDAPRTAANAAEASAADATLEAIHVGDAVLLWSFGGLTAEGGGCVYSAEAFEPGVFLYPSRSRHDPDMANIHAAAFEIYVPWDYKNQKRSNTLKEEVEALEAREEHAQDTLRKVMRELAANSGMTAAEQDRVKRLQAREAELTHELAHIASEKDRTELEAKRFMKLARRDQTNNTLEQQRQAGKPLLFGDRIQLRHVLSNKFLRINTAKTAALVPSGLGVELGEHSDRGCFFRVLPRFKVRTEGDVVRSGDQLLFASERAQGQYLAHSSGPFPAEDTRAPLTASLHAGLLEVCVAAQPCTWNVKRFSHPHPREIKAGDPIFIRGGDFIQFFDKEKEGFVAADTMVLRATPNAPFQALFLNRGVDEDGGLQEESKSFWQVSFAGARASGEVLTGEAPHQPVVLRNAVLGLFLAVQKAAPWEPFFTPDASDPRTAFVFLPFQTGGGSSSRPNAAEFEHKSYLILQHVASQTYLHTSSSLLESVSLATLRQEGGVQGASARSNAAHRVRFKDSLTYEDVFLVHRVPNVDVDDFNLVCGSLPILKQLVPFTAAEVAAALPSMQSAQAGKSKLVHPTWARAGPQAVAQGIALLEELAEFLQDQDEDDDSWGQDIYKRQGLLQDLGIFDIVVGLIRDPIARVPRGFMRSGMLPEYHDLWEAAFKVLMYGAAGDHSETDRYIASYYKTFFEHSLYIKTEGAAEVVLELIRDSRDIIDDLIARPELGFSWVLSHLDHAEDGVDTVDRDFLDMLSCFCVCNGLAVRRAQELILHKLFEDEDVYQHGHLYRFLMDTKGVTVLMQLGEGKEPAKLSDLCTLLPLGSNSPPAARSGEGTTQRRRQPASLRGAGDGKGSTNSSKGFKAALASEEDIPVIAYRVPARSRATDYELLLAQLALFRSMTDGCFAKAEGTLRGALPLDVVLTALFDESLTFGIRGAMAGLLMELYLDTSDFLATPLVERPQRCFTREQDQALPASQSSIKTRLHQFVVGRFAADAKAFGQEMVRLIRAEDEFEPYHRGHGNYIVSVLQLVQFFVGNGFYGRVGEEVGELYLMVAQHVLVDHANLVGEVFNDGDRERNTLVEEVLTSGIATLDHLLRLHRMETIATFVRDFVQVYDSVQSAHNVRLTARQACLTSLCEVTLAEQQGAPTARTTCKAQADEYIRHLFTETSFEQFCGLNSHGHGKGTLKGLLTALAQHPADRVTAGAIGCMQLMASRQEALREAVEDVRLLVHPDSIAAYALVARLDPVLHDIAYDKQIDEVEATEIMALLKQLRSELSHGGALSPAAQEILRCAYVVDDLLAVFDQTLDDDDLRPGQVTPLQRALADCLQFLGLVANGNEPMQERLFLELQGLVVNPNTRPPFVAAALAGCLRLVFQRPAFRIQVRESQIKVMVQLTCDLYKDGHLVPELLDLLRQVALPDGGTHMNETHALIVRYLLPHEANLLQLLGESWGSPGSTKHAFAVALVRLMAILSSGSNEFIESICSALFSVPAALDQLVAAAQAGDALAQTAFLEFLHDVHLSENCYVLLNFPLADPRWWQTLEACTALLQNKSASADAVNASVAVVAAFFRFHFQRVSPVLMSLKDGGSHLATGMARDQAQLAMTAPDTGDALLLTAAGVLERCGKVAAPLARALADRVAVLAEMRRVSSSQPDQQLHDTLLRCLFVVLRAATFESEESLAETVAYIQSRAPQKAERTDGGAGKAAFSEVGESPGRKPHAAHVFRSPERRIGPKDVLGLNAGLPHGSSSAAWLSSDAISSTATVETIFDAAESSGEDALALEEASMNACFYLLQQKLMLLHWDRNSAFHRCCRPDPEEEEEITSEWPCPYLEALPDGRTVLPCGYEYQRRVALLVEDPRLIDRLLHNLGVQGAILVDRNTSDDAREAAEAVCIDTMALFRALVQRDLCRLSAFEIDDYDEREKIWDDIHRVQTRLAQAGLVRHLLGALAYDRETLFRPGWELMATLCVGGCPEVQAIVLSELNRLDDTDCLLRLRSEVHRSLALVLQRRSALARSVASSAYAGLPEWAGDGQGVKGAGTLKSVSTLREEHLLALQQALGSLTRNAGAQAAQARQALVAAEAKEASELSGELRWLRMLCQGIQLLVEGSFTSLQDFLREQPKSGTVSVNFVAELCHILGATYTFISEGKVWLDLIDQVLDTLAELCQGNAPNQQEALDEQVVKYINYIIAYDTTAESDLLELTQTKRAALSVLEAMLETSDESARDMAHSLLASLNREELYLAMNRFYFLDLWVRRTWTISHPDEEVGDAPKEHLTAGFEAFFILRRLKDLTDDEYRWEAECSPGVAPKSGAFSSGMAEVIHATSGDADDARRRADEALSDKVEELLEAPRAQGGNTGSAFVEFSRSMLSELDTHGGQQLGLQPDRLDFYQQWTASIEFVRDEQLQKVYFRRPETVLSQSQRDEILLAVNRSSPQEKVRDFLNRFDTIRRKLQFQMKLHEIPILRLVAEGTAHRWKWAMLFFTLLLNILMLATWKGADDLSDLSPTTPSFYDPMLLSLGSVHLFLCSMVSTEYFLNLDTWRPSVASGYYVLLVLTSVLGLVFRGYFYSFHLMHIVAENDMLQRAIESITRNGVALFNVSLLIMALIYNFSVVGFAFLRDAYDPSDGVFCDTLLQCFVSTLTNGLRFGGGIGDSLTTPASPGSTYPGRVAFDLFFWVLISVISMNLVLGIIVDTFSQLRAERAAKMDDMHNHCFICSLPAHLFDATEGGFKKHIREEHNLWNYLYFTEYLEQMQPYERNYHESYLHAKLVQERDPSPFPVKRALRLSARAAEMEDVVAALAQDQRDLRKHLDAQIGSLRRLLQQALAVAGTQSVSGGTSASDT